MVIACVRVRRDVLVFNLQATFLLGFLINFASGLQWQRSGHSIILVAQKSKLCSGESKMSKIVTNFDYCLCSSCRAQFLSDLYLVHQLVGMMSHHPIFFVGLGSKSSE